jgi:hypothetical protein
MQEVCFYPASLFWIALIAGNITTGKSAVAFPDPRKPAEDEGIIHQKRIHSRPRMRGITLTTKELDGAEKGRYRM